MANNNYWQVFTAFERIEQNIASLLIMNRDIFKLLKYEDWQDNPYEMDIDDASIEDMLTEYTDTHQINPYCKIFFEPFVQDIETLQRSQIRIFPIQIQPYDIYEAEVYIQVDVIVNLAVNKFKGGRRMNALASKIIEALNGQEIGLLHRLELIDRPLRLYQFKSDYWGYSFIFRTGVAANGF
jgi:hypothetical protein